MYNMQFFAVVVLFVALFQQFSKPPRYSTVVLGRVWILLQTFPHSTDFHFQFDVRVFFYMILFPPHKYTYTSSSIFLFPPERFNFFCSSFGQFRFSFQWRIRLYDGLLLIRFSFTQLSLRHSIARCQLLCFTSRQHHFVSLSFAFRHGVETISVPCTINLFSFVS